MRIAAISVARVSVFAPQVTGSTPHAVLQVAVAVYSADTCAIPWRSAHLPCAPGMACTLAVAGRSDPHPNGNGHHLCTITYSQAPAPSPSPSDSPGPSASPALGPRPSPSPSPSPSFQESVSPGTAPPGETAGSGICTSLPRDSDRPECQGLCLSADEYAQHKGTVSPSPHGPGEECRAFHSRP